MTKIKFLGTESSILHISITLKQNLHLHIKLWKNGWQIALTGISKEMVKLAVAWRPLKPPPLLLTKNEKKGRIIFYVLPHLT